MIDHDHDCKTCFGFRWVCKHHPHRAAVQSSRSLQEVVPPSTNRHALDEKVRTRWANAGRCGRFSRLRRNLREERDSHRRASPCQPSSTPSVRVNMMNKRKPTYFRNSLDLSR